MKKEVLDGHQKFLINRLSLRDLVPNELMYYFDDDEDNVLIIVELTKMYLLKT